MLRYLLLSSFVTFLCIYAWKDWYRSLCGLIMMMAVSERYDMPRAMLGIVGVNPWNITLFFVLIAWLVSRRKEKLRWELSAFVNMLLIAYLVVILVAVVRALANSSEITAILVDDPLMLRTQLGFDLVIDNIFNSLKYVIPGLLLYHGCNSERRFWWGSAAILVAAFVLSLQVIKWMPVDAITDADMLQKAALRLLDKNIGYHRVDLAAITASAAWAFFVLGWLMQKSALRWCFLGCGFVSTIALALTAGRTGYFTWAILGIVIVALKYRRYLFMLPIVLVIVTMVVPAARERLLEGIVDTSPDAQLSVRDNNIDFAAVTSDRYLVWPTVIEKIRENPLLGYGKYGFIISGARQQVIDEHGEVARFPHPHNAYLQFLIDTGFLGTLPVIVLFGTICRRSVRLVKVKDNTIAIFAGILGLSFVFGQLIASIAAQSFYPRAGVVLMWCAIGLMLRVHEQYFEAKISMRGISTNQPQTT